MSAQLKTPGVYIKELNAFPNSVVEVPTAIPAFIGYTEKASNGSKSLHNIPTRITSLFEYSTYFGGAPDAKVKLKPDGGSIAGVDTSTQFYLYASLRLYFDNGGGPCWIVSAGSYQTAIVSGKLIADLTGDCLEAMKKELESTMIVVPDAMLLGSGAEAYSVAQQVLLHCGQMQSRIGIFDVYGGNQKRSNDESDVISGDSGLRSKLTSDFLNYGVAYYPWLYTNLIEDDQVDYNCLTPDSKPLLVSYLNKKADETYSDAKDQKKRDELHAIIQKITDEVEEEPPTPGNISVRKTNHNALFAVLPAYKLLMSEIKKELNILPPSGGIAGVYVRVDNNEGVQKAPANTTINSVDEPMVSINHDEQEDLNVPLNGMAVNAIRVLPGRGLLIWGARTLDGNSQDWRYVNVRRAVIMLEQSIKAAAQAYVFEPNTALTWSTVKNMIVNFLTQQWKAGVLMGSKPEDAFQVDVGLGSTMTGNDVLDGYMRVSVKVCMVRPAEFIEISFQQLMPTS